MKRRSSIFEFQDCLKKMKDKELKIDQLSDYEKMIQRNRDEKIAFLKSLKIEEAKENLNEAMKNLNPKRPVKPNRLKSPKTALTTQFPARQSLRLSNINIDLSEEAIVVRALAAAKQDFRKNLPPFLPFEEAIGGNKKVYADFARDYDDVKFQTPKPFTDYVSSFKNMKIDESKIAPVVNDRITALAIHPMKEKIIVSAGNKYGAIGFRHMNSDSLLYKFNPHFAGVTCLKFNSDSQNQIVSSSYDGTMRSGDLEKKVFTEVFNVSDETSCTYFDFKSATTILVCQENGNVSIVDIRSDSKSAQMSHRCHDYSVKTISIHPVNKSYFVTADSKGYLSLWDLRKLQKKPVIEIHHHRKVIHSAFFSPVTGNSILTTSADDSLCLFDSSKLGIALTQDIELRHNNCTGSRLSTFKATWLPNTDDAFVIGSMDFPRKIEIFNNQLDNIYNFQNAYMNCITSINVFHPSLPVLAGGGSSGKVYIFS